MPRNELRTSGMLQASLIGIVLAVALKDAAPASETALWPFLLGGYGLLAALVPWLAGGVSEGEMSLGYSAFLVLVFGLPMTVAAFLLVPTAYAGIGYGCLALAAASLLHLLAAVAIRLRRPTQ
jgi:hypothetical protein